MNSLFYHVWTLPLRLMYFLFLPHTKMYTIKMFVFFFCNSCLDFTFYEDDTNSKSCILSLSICQWLNVCSTIVDITMWKRQLVRVDHYLFLLQVVLSTWLRQTSRQSLCLRLWQGISFLCKWSSHVRFFSNSACHKVNESTTKTICIWWWALFSPGQLDRFT